jgi:predicted dehydrogenase
MILLVGVGPIGQAYARVLKAMGRDFEAVSRTRESAENFQAQFACPAQSGGVDAHLATNQEKYLMCIVAVPAPQLAGAVEAAIRNRIRRILVEKPAALSLRDLGKMQELARAHGAEVYVAYNRRFYASVLKLIELATEDGGISSLTFDFTEWMDRIRWEHKSDDLKLNWLIANSSHVIDLAFYMCGHPAKISCYQADATRSPDVSPPRFSGAGVTERGVLFSYHANWNAPGRWAVECNSRNFKFFLSPLEELGVVRRNTVQRVKIEVDAALDEEFKPGFYRQVDVFVNGGSGLMSLDEQVKRFGVYELIRGGEVGE